MSDNAVVEPGQKKVLSAEDIFAANDIEFAEIPGFKENEVFRIRSLTAGDFIEWTEANEGEAKRTAGLRLIIKSLVDENGKRILTDRHLEVLRMKAFKTTEKILADILKHNGIKTKKELLQEAKNE